MLYLHIGTGKAGTTSIQMFLSSWKDQIPITQVQSFQCGYAGKVANAWKIAAAANTDRSKWYWVHHRKMLTEKEYWELQKNFWSAVRQEVYGSNGEHFVGSSEYIYSQYGDDKIKIETLKRNLLSIFGAVKLLIYFREQVGYVKSVYAQRVKGPSKDTQSFRRFVESITLSSAQAPIDYAARVKLWGSIFGYENIEPVVFDRRNFSGGNLIHDFLARIDIETPSKYFGRQELIANRSPTFLQLDMIRFANKWAIENDKVRRLILSRYLGCFPPRRFPSVYDRKILEMVSDGNCWLNDKFFSSSNIQLPCLDSKDHMKEL